MKNDIAYANRDFIPDADAFIPRWNAAADAFRHRLDQQGRAQFDVSYGSGARQQFDLFRPDGAPKGVMIFVHGGYWRMFDKSTWSHFATGALARGWTVAVPSYTLAPEMRIAGITAEIAAAVGTIGEATTGPVALVGHSAGGHLVARMMCRDVILPKAVAARVKRCVPISPLSDLRPLIETSMNADFALDDAAAVAESPCLKGAPRNGDIAIWVGGNERPAFIDQARWLHDAWPGSPLHVAPGLHHFDVIDGLTDPDSPLMSAVLGD